jgi:hypothetical protein
LVYAFVERDEDAGTPDGVAARDVLLSGVKVLGGTNPGERIVVRLAFDSFPIGGFSDRFIFVWLDPSKMASEPTWNWRLPSDAICLPKSEVLNESYPGFRDQSFVRGDDLCVVIE